jgi:CheY-like chemotaxis protein
MAIAKIIVIEDEDSVRETLIEILEVNDYQVLTSNSIADGLNLIFNELPDLIISDIMMQSKEDGFILLDRVRREPTTASIPFIFLSARADAIRQGMGMGVEDYITKPFSISDLLESVNARLKRSQILQQKATKFDEAFIIMYSPSLPVQGQRFEVGSYLHIGRTEHCECRLKDRLLSRVTATIVKKRHAVGVYWISDGPAMGKEPQPSAHGVWINGHRITHSSELRGGEQVRLSPYTWFTFHLKEPECVGEPTLQ